MSLANFSDLKTSVAEFANRSDLSDGLIADFISLAEAEFNNRLRMIDQEVIYDFEVTGRYTPIFSDIAEIRTIEYKGDQILPMSYLTPENMTRLANTTGGRPMYYSLRGVQIEVLPIQTSATITIHYWRTIPPLSTFEPTNWLLLKHPNMYLYECLRQVSIWAKDDNSIVRYSDILASYYRKMDEAAVAKRFGGTSLAMVSA